MKNTLMMFVAIFAGSFSSSSWAACRVYIPNTIFSHESGYSIQLDFTKILSKKGYVETSKSNESDHTLEFVATERVGPRFHFAETQIAMSGIRGSFDKMCLTQMCSIQDFARSFSKAIRRFDRVLPKCE